MSWNPWRPTRAQPWNLARVVHLHRRAGFGATWDELQRDLSEGYKPSIDRVLRSVSAEDSSEFDSVTRHMGLSAVGSNRSNQLKAWWILRMLRSPYPLREKLTLMWHNHFATSNAKVGNLAAMKDQNETFYRLATGEFGKLLQAIAVDPAMLIWLDAPSNRKGRPNENLARELLELFTLGIGNYSETDVREAARALTGWSLDDRGRFKFLERQHDDGEKSILGKTGRWDGHDLLTILLDHPATSQRLTWRLCDTFMGEGMVPESDRQDLAEMLRKEHLNIGQTVDRVLRSEFFFDEKNIGSRVISPIEFVITPLRSLTTDSSSVSTIALSDWLDDLGQDPFHPPNVGGWKGGRHWLSTRYVVMRANFADCFVKGGLRRRRRRGETEPSIHQRFGIPAEADPLNHCAQVLSGGRIPANTIDRIRSAVIESETEYSLSDEERNRRSLTLLLSMPESQQG